MRNLAGRLTARSINELLRIAEFWETPVSGRDRHAVVGQLYREMREMRTARDIWARLDEPERQLILLLALDDRAGDRSRTLPELAAGLNLELDAARDIAVSLYRKGILYREGDADELPVGEMPRVFLPRELTAVFRRVQDEIDAGPLTQAPFAALLALLDDAEIEQAAQAWGLQVVAGLDDRDEIAEQLPPVIQDDSRRTRVIATLGRDARHLWELLLANPGHLSPLETLLDQAGLDAEGAATAQRRRNAIGQLEERLLVWHSYARDEQRWLFVPDLVAGTGRTIERSARRPDPLASDSVIRDDWIHPFAVPWDLLTLLRALVDPHHPEIIQFEDAPARWLEEICTRFWNSSQDDDRSAGYLTFLAALGRDENVFQGGGAEGPLQPGRSWKTWRSRGFADQFSHLVWWWNASLNWIEAGEQSDIIVRNATLPQFRRKVLVLLAELDDGEWYRVPEVSRWIVDLDPDILGEGASIAMASSLPVPPGHHEWGRLASAEVVRTTLQTAFAWFGLVDTGRDDTGVPVLRTTTMLRTLESAQPVTDEADPAGPAVTIRDDLLIELRAPAPLRVWAISAFAEQKSLRPTATYRLTEASMLNALQRGATVNDVIRFLEQETGEPLPNAVLERIQGWPLLQRNVAMHVEVIVEPGQQEQAQAIGQTLREAGWQASEREGRVLVRLNASQRYEEQLRELDRLLAHAGYAIHANGPPYRPAATGQQSGDPLP